MWDDQGSGDPRRLTLEGKTLETVSLEHRQQVLMMALTAETAQGGRIVAQDQTSAVIVRVDPINHVLHALLSLITCGVWLLVWFVLNANRGIHRYQVTVDELGAVRRLPPPAMPVYPTA